MINSFHCDEKTVFFDYVILMSENTMKEIRFIRIIGFAFVRHDSAIQIYLMALAAPSVRRQKGFLRTVNGANYANYIAAWSFARRMGEGVFLKHE